MGVAELERVRDSDSARFVGARDPALVSAAEGGAHLAERTDMDSWREARSVESAFFCARA